MPSIDNPPSKFDKPDKFMNPELGGSAAVKIDVRILSKLKCHW